MRIISQNRDCDIPYETSIIEVSRGFVYAKTPGGKYICIGNYQSLKKARKVLECIRQAYENEVDVYKMPVSEEIQ